jgi:hypothetical protein
VTIGHLYFLLYIVQIEGMNREFSVTIPFPAHLAEDEAASLVEHTGVLDNALNHKFGLVPELQGRPWTISERMVIDDETNHMVFAAENHPF